MPNEPEWLSAEDLIAFNEIAVGETGEPHLVRDRGLLESAAASPRNAWVYEAEADLVALAVRLLFAVARNHPFAQGNKRTAVMAAFVFLERNGCVLMIEDARYPGDLIEDALASPVAIGHVHRWLAARTIRPAPPTRLDVEAANDNGSA